MTAAPQSIQPMTEFPNEEILPDDYPIYGNYLYVADGRVIMSDWHGVTVGYMKAKEGFKEVRRCNIYARKAARASGEARQPGES